MVCYCWVLGRENKGRIAVKSTSNKLSEINFEQSEQQKSNSKKFVWYSFAISITLTVTAFYHCYAICTEWCYWVAQCLDSLEPPPHPPVCLGWWLFWTNQKKGQWCHVWNECANQSEVRVMMSCLDWIRQQHIPKISPSSTCSKIVFVHLHCQEIKI